MPEDKPGKKKCGKVKRISNWIGLGLFCLLIIATVVLQAPWKVIVLLLAIAGNGTVVPKRIARWIWYSAAVLVIGLIVWVFLPSDNEGWRPYTFDEELAALEAKYAIPDEQNAAVVYNQLFEVPILDQNDPEFFAQSKPSVIQLFWLSQEHPETAAWLQKHRATIAILLKATQMKKCHFAITADPLADLYPMHSLVKMRQYGQMLVAHANNDIAEGRIDEGLETCAAALGMARHLNQQPTMLDLLVGYAIEALAIRQLERFIISTDVTEGHLQAVEQVLNEVEHDWGSDISRVLEYDRLWAKNGLCCLVYEIDPKGRVRLGPDPMRHIRAYWPDISEAPTYWQSKLTKALTILRWFFMPGTPQAVGKIIDKGFERYFAMAKPDYDWETQSKRLFSRIPYIVCSHRLLLGYRYFPLLVTNTGEESYYAQRELYLRAIANKRGTELLIALRRYKNGHGRWPLSLDDIRDITAAENFVDPINNSSFVYKLSDDSFMLYSKGKNNIDEDGKRKDDADDQPIWPPMSRKTKKEDANAE
jgi:hypothetical protein